MHSSVIATRRACARWFSVRPQLDLKNMMQHVPSIQANVESRRVQADPEKVHTLYAEHCELTQRGNELRHQRKLLAKEMRATGVDREALAQQGRELKETVSTLESQQRTLWEDLMVEALKIPNDTDPDAPISDEVVVDLVGSPRQFEFEPKPHEILAARLGLCDFESASKVTGPKFVYLQRAAALLELGLQQWAMHKLVKGGFTPVVTPDMAHSWVVEGCGFNPRGEHTQVYRVQGTDLCLVGTAEIPLAGLVSDNIYQEAQLPLKLVGQSHCFRTEAGAAGAAEKGLYRLHQFSKVEMFVVCTPEQSEEMLSQLVQIERQLLEELELHFKIIDMPPHELGGSAYRKYDIEAWMPGKGEFGEVTSASNCTEYQSRRLGIKIHRDDGSKVFAHTLNGTAAAIPRLIISILETHQNADGSVRVPQALQPFVGLEKIDIVMD